MCFHDVLSFEKHAWIIQALITDLENRQQTLLQEINQRNLGYFRQEVEKPDAWADDLTLGLEQDNKEIDREVKEIHRTAATAPTLDEKLHWQKRLQVPEAKRNKLRTELFDRQDEIESQGKMPLLIDPTKEQPWRYLDFEPTTGNLVARFDPQTDQYFSKGEITVDTLHLDRREALAAGYKKTFNRLAETATTFLNTPGNADDLIAKLREQDDHGLLGWVFLSTGKTITPFNDLHQSQPAIWTICQTAFSD